MNLGMHGQDEGGSGLARGVVVIVVVGIALGVTFNAMQLKSGPRRGLAWIKHEVKLASLESVANAAESAPAAATGGTDSSQAAGQAASPAAEPVAQVRTDSTRADSAHAARPPKAGKGAKGAKPTAAATAAASKTSKAHGAVATPTTATPAPAAAAAAAAKATDVPTVPDTKEPLEAQYATIKKLWDAGAALFVDARSADEYAEGHIPGAVSMPFDDVFKDPDKAKHLDTHDRKVVITYCGGGDCDLSRNLAFSLIDAGHKKVLVFMGGLPGWKEAGNAAATGKTPGTAP